MAEEFSPGIPMRPVNTDSVLINGLGCFLDIENDKSNCDTIPISVFYMQYGMKIRLRLDNAGSTNCPLEFTVC